MARHESLDALLRRVRACTICAPHLPLGPRPVLQAGRSARLLIAGQAPGRKVHASGIPFDDASGQRLRDWLGLTPDQFYDPALVAILPMGFCYPGKGASGDAPPRPECAPAWRAQLLAHLPHIALTVVLGQYALAWHMPDERDGVTQAVQNWQRHWPRAVALPHPSPRNNGWLKRNPWFEAELLPRVRTRVGALLAPQGKSDNAFG
ncbi:uracil-DNA glycosylase family protein [[Acidovorax] ebreus]|uniref:uracil-DNA glycosylase family protein n=1 Tax=Diaphorobacter sp. LI3 TaxID=2952886 RepID=UPI0020623DB1|nr:uracil-DNA glycosylase family protein [Diaphorobacter sp. LI3]